MIGSNNKATRLIRVPDKADAKLVGCSLCVDDSGAGVVSPGVSGGVIAGSPDVGVGVGSPVVGL